MDIAFIVFRATIATIPSTLRYLLMFLQRVLVTIIAACHSTGDLFYGHFQANVHQHKKKKRRRAKLIEKFVTCKFRAGILSASLSDGLSNIIANLRLANWWHLRTQTPPSIHRVYSILGQTSCALLPLGLVQRFCYCLRQTKPNNFVQPFFQCSAWSTLNYFYAHIEIVIGFEGRP